MEMEVTATVRIKDNTDDEEEHNVNGTLTITLPRQEIAELIAKQYEPLLQQFPDLVVQHLDTNLGHYDFFLDFCVEADDPVRGREEEITWWLKNRHTRPTGHDDESLPMCPYCEEHIDHLAYNGESYYCPRSSCDTTITTDIREANAFMQGKWDGRGDYEGE